MASYSAPYPYRVACKIPWDGAAVTGTIAREDSSHYTATTPCALLTPTIIATIPATTVWLTAAGGASTFTCYSASGANLGTVTATMVQLSQTVVGSVILVQSNDTATYGSGVNYYVGTVFSDSFTLAPMAQAGPGFTGFSTSLNASLVAASSLPSGAVNGSTFVYMSQASDRHQWFAGGASGLPFQGAASVALGSIQAQASFSPPATPLPYLVGTMAAPGQLVTLCYL